MNSFKKKTAAALLAIVLALIPCAALADFTDTADEGYYTIFTREGNLLTMVAGAVNTDDEYISRDNKHYVIFSVNENEKQAWAREIDSGVSPETEESAMFTAATGGNSDRKIAIYCTHSDESYIPTDGVSSNEVYGGIYDVADALSQELKGLGVEVVQDYTTHLPHDSGAYRRSRATAVNLLKTMPDALIDIHRDGVPAEQYESEFSEDDITMVRLLIGKNNPNSAANKNFAQQLKANGDEMHPGLIKDIYIGKGNYNQELAPNSILLEFGTHETSKEQAEASTKYMAQVLTQTLYGSVAPSQSAGDERGNAQNGVSPGPDSSGPAGGQDGQNNGSEPIKGSSAGAWSGIWWILGIAVGGGLIFLLYSKGGGRFGHNVKRGASELTGGLVGEAPDDEDKDEFDRE